MSKPRPWLPGTRILCPWCRVGYLKRVYVHEGHWITGDWRRVCVGGMCPNCGLLLKDAGGILVPVTRALNRLPRVQ